MVPYKLIHISIISWNISEVIKEKQEKDIFIGTTFSAMNFFLNYNNNDW